MKKAHLVFLFVGLLALAAAQVATPAHAADAAPAKSGEGGKADSGKSKGGDDVTGGRFAGDPVFVHIPPIVLPIIGNNGVEQLVNILLIVQVKDVDVASDLHNNMPRVIDSLLRHLYGELGEGSLRDGKLVSVVRVKRKAVSAVSEIIGADNIIDVLVQGVSQRVL
jgi:hypothetical protein